MTMQSTNALQAHLYEIVSQYLPEGYTAKIRIEREGEINPREAIRQADAIADLVYEFTGTSKDILSKKCRKQGIVLTKKLLCYFLKTYTNLTLTAIGSYCRYEHTEVMKAIKTLNDWELTDAGVKEKKELLNDFIISNFKI